MQISFALLLCTLGAFVCPIRAYSEDMDGSAQNEIQTSGIDREIVRVVWTNRVNGNEAAGPLQITCGLTTRRARGHESTACWYMAKNVVDRITEKSAGKEHRLYRREISDDGRAMMLTWWSEEGHTNVILVRTFDRTN